MPSIKTDYLLFLRSTITIYIDKFTGTYLNFFHLIIIERLILKQYVWQIIKCSLVREVWEQFINKAEISCRIVMYNLLYFHSIQDVNHFEMGMLMVHIKYIGVLSFTAEIFFSVFCSKRLLHDWRFKARTRHGKRLTCTIQL